MPYDGRPVGEVLCAQISVLPQTLVSMQSLLCLTNLVHVCRPYHTQLQGISDATLDCFSVRRVGRSLWLAWSVDFVQVWRPSWCYYTYILLQAHLFLSLHDASNVWGSHRHRRLLFHWCLVRWCGWCPWRWNRTDKRWGNSHILFKWSKEVQSSSFCWAVLLESDIPGPIL